MGIFSDSFRHYWVEGIEPDCGTATHVGPCRWPREPKLPMCNAHLCAFFARARARGAKPDDIRALKFPGEVSADAMAEAFAKYLAHVAPKESGTERT
jgi:hypothetical protein